MNAADHSSHGPKNSLHLRGHPHMHAETQFPYPVSGGYVSRSVIVMHGAAPVVDPYTCTVLWYTWDSANAHPSYSLIKVGGSNLR